MTNLAPNVINHYNKVIIKIFQPKLAPKNSMPKPQKPFQPQKIQQTINRQSWLIFILMLGGIGLDSYLQQKNFIITKNILIGSILAWLGQLIFAKIALGVTGRYHRKIVHRMYQASIVKWAFSLVGFTLIFIYLKPLSAIWVFLGYIILQISYAIMGYRLKL